MTDSPKIEERENGPLVASNVRTIKSTLGQPIDAKPVMALCRCGASKNKPFCDGSHQNIGFESASQDIAARDKVLVYGGNEASVSYNRLLCSHAAECSARLEPVFNPSRKPWVVPDNGTMSQLREVVRACPSGALRLSEHQEPPEHLVTDEALITVEKNGPYRITNIVLEDVQWAKGASKQKYVLCRCGLSGNKPFCDGSHYNAGWSDDSE